MTSPGLIGVEYRSVCYKIALSEQLSLQKFAHKECIQWTYFHGKTNLTTIINHIHIS